MERVSIIKGQFPAIFIAPHGPNDDYTADIAETLANKLNAYAVINRGWERSENVDIFNDKANCNYLPHLKQDVVREEFLEPILSFYHEILNNQRIVNINGVNLFIFIIHGINCIPHGVDVDLVLGYGQGLPRRFTAPKQFIAWFESRTAQFLTVFHGVGQYAGWSRQNLNQYFTNNPEIASLQLEIDKQHRTTQHVAIDFALQLAETIEHLDEYVIHQGEFKVSPDQCL